MDILSEIAGWIQGNKSLLLEGAGVWILLLVATIVAVRYYLVSIPPDHFARGHEPLGGWRISHPALRWTLLIVKNTVGAILAFMGLIMLVTPGPGWIALLLGLALLDIPGKRTVERKIVQRPLLLEWINRIRSSAGQPALVFTPSAHVAQS